MKRFYKVADVTTADGGHGVMLDGKPLRTPAKVKLIVPSRALAEAIADEWRAQGEDIKLDTLPLTRIASTAIDLVTPRRAEVGAEVARYAGTDLVCYRAGHPPELARRQHAAWQPLIDWTTQRYDATLDVTIGVVPIDQPVASLRAFAAAVGTYPPPELAALHLATAACGSLVVALALIEGRLDAEEAFATAQLDETFEIELWGEDAEQTQRRALLKGDIAIARRFIDLVRA
jgi:chaperone required for assembly of F1-ATPase